MKVQEIMTAKVEYLKPGASLREAARKMCELNCGFLPVSDAQENRLLGVLTDRDIVVRGVVDGVDANTTSVAELMTSRVLYCFTADDLSEAIDSMRAQQVYRLVVLNNPDEKRLAGVITLGDIVRHGETDIAERAAQSIAGVAA